MLGVVVLMVVAINVVSHAQHSSDVRLESDKVRNRIAIGDGMSCHLGLQLLSRTCAVCLAAHVSWLRIGRGVCLMLLVLREIVVFLPSFISVCQIFFYCVGLKLMNVEEATGQSAACIE